MSKVVRVFLENSQRLVVVAAVAAAAVAVAAVVVGHQTERPWHILSTGCTFINKLFFYFVTFKGAE
jgi:hypothetical protein